MLHKSFKPAKCKTSLNLAKSRIKLMKNRKDIQLKQLKREVAQLLESKHDQTARIRVEHVVREEKMMAAYEMIEIYCELVVARLPIIESQKNCPLDLKEAIASLIFAAPRCGDITELQDVRKHFTAKYGKDFASAAVELRPNCGVSRSLVEKLSVNAPDGPTKVKILTAIAEEHNIQWEPNWFKDEAPLPSVDISNVTAYTVEGNKIQMQPLNVEIADDIEEKHARDTVKPGISFQSNTHTSSDLVPPSSSSLDSRHSENPSEKIAFRQSSGTSESAFSAGRPKWNMEFKDATAAAQAAAESAELASIAARAAAELSIRSSVMGESSLAPSHSPGQGYSENKLQSAASVQQHGHVPRNSTSGSFNQRSPKNQGDVDRRENTAEGVDPTSLYKDYSEIEEQYERGNQYFTHSKTGTRNDRDFDYSPVTPKTEPNVFKSSNFGEYEHESTENPFNEEPVENLHQPSIFQSHPSDVGDDYGVFASLNYDKYDDDTGDGFFDGFSRNTVDQEDWQVRSTYSYGEEGMPFNDHREGHSVSGGENLFKNHREGSRDLESDVKERFDSDRDIFVKMDQGGGAKDSDYKSNRTNDVVFDESGSDDDKFVLNSAEEHDTSSPSKLTHKDSSFDPYNPHYEPDLSKSFRSSSIYLKLNEPLPVNYDSDGANSGSEKEQQIEKTDAGVASFKYRKPDVSPHLEFPTSSDVVKENADALKTIENFEENQSRNQNSEFEDRTQLKPEGGMELNLGSVPAGRRNRAQWRIPRLGLTEASSNTYTYSDKPTAFESSSDKPKPRTMGGFHTHFDPTSNDTELESTPKDLDSIEGPYAAISPVSFRGASPKDPSGYFVSDDSKPEEDVPKPVTNKTFVGAALSRRTKASAPRSKTGQSSSSYTTEVSRSRNVDQSSHDKEPKTFSQNSGSKASKDDQNSYSPVEEISTALESSNVTKVSSSIDKAPSRENSAKMPGHVHPKLPDFETFTAHLQSLKKNRQ